VQALSHKLCFRNILEWQLNSVLASLALVSWGFLA